MKIDKDAQAQLPQGITRSSSSDPGAGAPKTEARTPADAPDKVELSNWKAEVERLKARAKETPDIDEAKVARIKQALESGEYGVDSKALARSILKDHLSGEID